MVVIVAFTVIAVLAAPLVFRLYSLLTDAAVDATEYRSVGTALARVFLVQIFFYGLNAVGVGACCNARRRFFAAAWAPALANVVIIASLLLVPAIIDGAARRTRRRARQPTTALDVGARGDSWASPSWPSPSLPALMAAKVRRCASIRTSATQPCARCARCRGWALGYVVANQVGDHRRAEPVRRSGDGNQDRRTPGRFTFFVLPHGLLAMSIATTFLPEMSQRRSDAETGKRLIDRTSLGISD